MLPSQAQKNLTESTISAKIICNPYNKIRRMILRKIAVSVCNAVVILNEENILDKTENLIFLHVFIHLAISNMVLHHADLLQQHVAN